MRSPSKPAYFVLIFALLASFGLLPAQPLRAAPLPLLLAAPLAAPLTVPLPGPLAAPLQQEPQPQPQESVTVLAAGDIAKCNLEWDGYTGALLDNLPGPILGLGDNAYVQGSLQEFNDCYGPTWGRHKDRVYPVPGNHEYLTGGAEGYFTYFGDRATPLEPGCRKECKGYYSFNLGAWHIVALNSEINIDPGSEQDQWLRADLAANPSTCTLAFWHKPRWSTGRHGTGASAPLFNAVYEYGVDIVLSGHDHNYERFAPQNPEGVAEPDRGVRQFVVGTGGDSLRGPRSDSVNSEVRNSDTWGVLKLTLNPTSYDWEFIPISYPGQTFTDKGSGNCVIAPNAPPPPAGVTAVSTGAAPVTVADDADAAADAGAADTGAAGTGTSAAVVPPEGLDYVVQAGDTLSLIAIRYGLDWQEVARVNGITNTEVIEIGQVIRLPGVDETTAPASTAAGTATGTAAGTTTGATAGTAAGTAAGTTSAAGGTTYTVVAGDTLFGIALSNNVTLAELTAANNIAENDLLLIGQELVIPGVAAPAPSLTALQPSATATATATATVTGTRGVTTTTGVTSTAGVTTTRPTTTTLSSLRPAGVTATATTTGTTGTAAGTGTAPAGTPAVHTVAVGDTIISIALEYNLDWQDLLDLNGLQPNSLLRIGQEIKLR